LRGPAQQPYDGAKIREDISGHRVVKCDDTIAASRRDGCSIFRSTLTCSARSLVRAFVDFVACKIKALRAVRLRQDRGHREHASRTEARRHCNSSAKSTVADTSDARYALGSAALRQQG
jgi:hypothetical protein